MDTSYIIYEIYEGMTAPAPNETRPSVQSSDRSKAEGALYFPARGMGIVILSRRLKYRGKIRRNAKFGKNLDIGKLSE